MKAKLVIVAIAVTLIAILVNYQSVTQAINRPVSSANLQNILQTGENSIVFVQDVSPSNRTRFTLKEIGQDYVKLESIEDSNFKTMRAETYYVPFTSIKSVMMVEKTMQIFLR